MPGILFCKARIRPSSLIVIAVALGLGILNETKQHLRNAGHIALELKAVLSLLWVLPATVLLLAKQGEKERAIELHALASRFPLVVKSVWFADIAGRERSPAAASFPTEMVATAHDRGLKCDPMICILEFVQKLGC